MQHRQPENIPCQQ